MEYLVGIAILPVILLCSYINKHDKDKEPKELLKKVFIRGMLMVIPILFFELIISYIYGKEENLDMVNLFASTFIGVALIEEMFKWFVVYKHGYKNKEFNHAYDAIVYSVYSSLGFAVVENVLYVLGNGFTTGLARALLAVPSHACDGVLMGYFFGKAKQSEYNGDQTSLNRFMTLSILIPVTAHAVYDYLLFTGKTMYLIIFFIFVIVIYIICFRIIKKVFLVEKNFDGTEINIKQENNNIINHADYTKAFYHAVIVMLIISIIIAIVSYLVNL